MRLTRLPRDELDEPRYLHPNGYVIVRWTRSWSERVGRIHGQADPPSPMRLWEVYVHVAPSASDVGRVYPWARRGGSPCFTAETLRDARAYCDRTPREGWA